MKPYRWWLWYFAAENKPIFSFHITIKFLTILLIIQESQSSSYTSASLFVRETNCSITCILITLKTKIYPGQDLTLCYCKHWYYQRKHWHMSQATWSAVGLLMKQMKLVRTSVSVTLACMHSQSFPVWNSICCSTWLSWPIFVYTGTIIVCISPSWDTCQRNNKPSLPVSTCTIKTVMRVF